MGGRVWEEFGRILSPNTQMILRLLTEKERDRMKGNREKRKEREVGVGKRGGSGVRLHTSA